MTETEQKPEPDKSEFEDLDKPRSKTWEYLDRYKTFPWWVRYGLLVAVLGLLFLQFTPMGSTIGNDDNKLPAYLIFAGLIAVLIANWGYRAGEHKSEFIHKNAQWLFYGGLLMIYGPLLWGVLSSLSQQTGP